MDRTPLTDEQFAAIKELMLAIVELTLRPLYTELTVLSTVVQAWKKARPAEVATIERICAIAHDSADINKSVDQRIESILRVVNSLDQPSRDRVIEALIEQYSRATTVN